MLRRTTVEIDEAVLGRAKRALGCGTTKATIDEALRRAADSADEESLKTAERQAAYFSRLAELTDPEVLASDEMWR